MRILLIKTSSLGDVVHNLPIVTDIHHHDPAAVIDWVVEESFVDIPRLHPGLRRVITVSLRRWRKSLFSTDTWREIAAFRRDLHTDQYDVVLDTQGLIKSALIARQAALCTNGRRLGHSAESAREPFAARFYDAGFAIPRAAHAVERNRWLAAAAFGYEIESNLDYSIRAAPFLANWLPAQPYAVLLAGTSRADKLWPEAEWIELAIALKLPVVLPSGNVEERERVQRLVSNIPDAIVAPPLAIRDLAGLLAGAQLVVGVDTGLTHLAAALNRPTIAIFGGSDPELTGVYAGPLAVNIGRPGVPPTASEIVVAAKALLP